MPCCVCCDIEGLCGEKGGMSKHRGPIIEVEKETIVRLRDVGCDNIATDDAPDEKYRDEGTDNIATDKNYMEKAGAGKNRMKTFIKHLTMANTQPPLTTHILDTSLGMPATNVPMILSIQKSPGNFTELEKSSTNNDGRGGFLKGSNWKPGVYKLHFDTGAYFTKQKIEGFYPYADIVFTIKDPDQHYHVPLLLSPFSYSTYRGS